MCVTDEDLQIERIRAAAHLIDRIVIPEILIRNDMVAMKEIQWILIGANGEADEIEPEPISMR